jgi:hypothetical protein
MKFLFVHQNFPAQYVHLVRHLAVQPEHEIIFITQRKDATLPGVKNIVYQPQRPITKDIHHYLRDTEGAVLNAQGVVRAGLALKESGFVPDVMLGHNGWGEIWYGRSKSSFSISALRLSTLNRFAYLAVTLLSSL